jgi:ubiquinone/menaquinone biosynthesis C-methylase UbiE
MAEYPSELDWHKRFQIQASWTEQLRIFLYDQIGIKQDSRILEVGCGTGVITSELLSLTSLNPEGVDISFPRLKIAAENNDRPCYLCADAYHLPYRSDAFDFVLTHFFFLWIKDALPVLKEMIRIMKPGGTVIALAEPDYFSRIDAPPIFEALGYMQTNSLISQGVNPTIGRRLPELFSTAGLFDLQFGASGFQSQVSIIPEWWNSEWEVIKSDLSTVLSNNLLEEFKIKDFEARKNGSRVLWVPTFYVYGKKHKLS